jgi:hypothetical protein
MSRSFDNRWVRQITCVLFFLMLLGALMDTWAAEVKRWYAEGLRKGDALPEILPH